MYNYSIVGRAVTRWGLGGLQPPQFLTDQLTLSQPGGADYAHHSTTSPPGFSDLATALVLQYQDENIYEKLKLKRLLKYVQN